MSPKQSSISAVARREKAGAAREGRFAQVLQSIDPTWGTQVFNVGDGIAVLMGPGLFVNRVMALGLEQSVDEEQLTLFEERCREIGVVPRIEVSEATLPDVVAMLEDQGYAPSGTEQALASSLDSLPSALPAIHHDISVVTEATDVAVWEDCAAQGWGHIDPARRRASDAFARTAHQADEPGLLLARARPDGRVLGCATLAVSKGLAVLGGMSTLPDERGQGVQTALIAERLRMARDLGAVEALSTAAPGQASERNLLRLGFAKSHQKVSWERLA